MNQKDAFAMVLTQAIYFFFLICLKAKEAFSHYAQEEEDTAVCPN
jgi:hypothetical protein